MIVNLSVIYEFCNYLYQRILAILVIAAEQHIRSMQQRIKCIDHIKSYEVQVDKKELKRKRRKKVQNKWFKYRNHSKVKFKRIQNRKKY